MDDATSADLTHARLRAAFQRAWEEGAKIRGEFPLRVGGREARLRIVGGPAAQRLARPFTHLGARRPSGPPSLTIDLWDQASSGVGCGGRPPPSPSPGERARIGVAGDGRWVERRAAEGWTALDRRSGSLVGWIEDASALGVYQVFTPLQSELALWLRDQDILLVHAAVVVHQSRGAFLAGPGAAGKTTALLASLQAGMSWLADDRVGLEEASAGGFRAHGLYATLAEAPDACHARAGSTPGKPADGRVSTKGDKAFAFLTDLWPESVAREASLQVIVLPRRAEREWSRLRRATSRQALLRLLPTTLPLVPPVARREAVERLGRFVKAVPAWWLDVGSDGAQVARQMESVLCGSEDDGS